MKGRLTFLSGAQPVPTVGRRGLPFTHARRLMYDNDRLSQIETLWSVVRRAHDDGASQVTDAQQQMLDRYGGAAQRYLRAVVKDADASEDVYQDFAVRFLRGDFANVSPERGKFRAFLKTVLFRTAMDHFRQKRRGPDVREMETMFEPSAPDERKAAEEQFVSSWRDEILSRTWDALKRYEEETSKPMHTAMRLRVDQPKLRSPELAESLAQELGRDISAANVRVILHRAREKFAELLLDEVVQSLEEPTRDELEEELGELKLLDYCRPALEKRDEP